MPTNDIAQSCSETHAESLPDELVAEAAHWHTVMQAESVSDGERAEFSEWMSVQAHAEAYQRMDALWQDIDDIEPASARSAIETSLRKNDGRKKQLATGVGLCVLLTLAGFYMAPGSQSLRDATLSGRLFADYRTNVGETQEIILNDNSRLRLNTFSSVDIEYTKEQRVIHLRQGEIIIDVASDPERPLVVVTDQGTAMALGTAFSVYEHSGATKVTVTESRVEVCAGQGNQCRRLHAGQHTTMSDGRVQLPQPNNSRVKLDWSRQLLIVEEQPVLDVLDELVRHHPGYVRIDRDALVNEMVSGVFALNDFAKSLQALEGSTSVKVSRYTRWYTVIGN